MNQPTPPGSFAKDTVARFRGRPPRPDLSPGERRVLAVLIAHLVFLPWAIGTMHVWSQLVSLGLGMLGLAVALIPDRTAAETNPGESALRRLIAFPGFWAGIAVFAYVGIQAANPAWGYHADGAYWWLEPIAHVAWLPAGMTTPFENAGQLRSLVVLVSLWSLVCTAWIGIRRRRGYQVLAVAMVINAGLLSVVGLAQYLAGADRILWFVESSNSSFFGTFIYRNHAGPWLNLGVALASGLAWSFHARSARRLEKSSPAPVFAFLAIVIGLGVVFSLSRGSIVVLLMFALAMAAGLALRALFKKGDARSRTAAAVLAVVLVLFVAVGLQRIGIERVTERFSTLVDGADASAHLRTIASSASSEMLADRWALGWGAGAFRFGFPIYQMKHPEIYFPGGSHFGNRLHWEHAHNDWLQWPIEYGAVGMLLLLATPVFLVIRFLRAGGLTNPFGLPVLLGCVLVLFHGAGDFVFQNPAVLATWTMLLVIAARWSEFDEPAAAR